MNPAGERGASIKYMEYSGLVKEIRDKFALVVIDRTDSCSEWETIRGKPDPGGNSFWARNLAGAKSGDKVVIRIPKRKFIITMLIIYALPLLAILGGAFLGKWVERKQNLVEQAEELVGNTAFLLFTQNVPSLILGAAFLVLCFGFIWIWNRRLEKQNEFQPLLMRVLGVSDDKAD